jgi:hypothetical protein
MAELKAKTRDELPATACAEPDKQAYSVGDKSHALSAKARASQAVEAGELSKGEEVKIDKMADSVLKTTR